jgi:hypothetical protein
MKKLRILALLMGAPMALLFLSRCSNDFDLVADWKEIPVVYGIISPADTAHYIRVEKAFLDPTRSALEVAKIADSLYYPEGVISVFLVRVTNNTEYPLKRVDGRLEGIPRADGTFATEPNWLYKIKASDISGGLRENEKYRLLIRRADGQPDITGETFIPREVTLTVPNTNDTPPRIQFFPSTPTTFRWLHDANGVYFDVYLSIRYREENNAGSILSRDTLLWKPGNSILAESAQTTKFSVPGTSFYSFLVEKIPPAEAGRRRYFDRCEVIVEGGGREIRDFILTNEANSGLTGAEIIQTYTNMSEGYGIFTAKSRGVFPGIRIWEETIDSMKLNPATAPLRFEFF